MLFLNKTQFPHVNIWCMSIACCQHIETYCFYWMSHLLWKHREYAISTCFCPSEYHPFLCLFILLWSSFRDPEMKRICARVHGLHFFIYLTFLWGNTDAILLSYHSFRLICFNSKYNFSSVCYHMPDDHFSCSQLFKRVWAEGQVLESMILSPVVFPLIFRNKALVSL